MVVKKEDLRIVKTKRAIKEALFKLIKEKGFERMTVQHIADEAMINRNTFYTHYLDKYDLMEKITDDYLKRFEESLENPSTSEIMTTSDFKLTLKRVFSNIEEDMTFYQLQLHENSQVQLQIKLKTILKNHILKNIHQGDLLIAIGKKEEVALEYMISGILGVIWFWIENSKECTVDETIELLYELHYNNLTNLLVHFETTK